MLIRKCRPACRGFKDKGGHVSLHVDTLFWKDSLIQMAVKIPPFLPQTTTTTTRTLEREVDLILKRDGLNAISCCSRATKKTQVSDNDPSKQQLSKAKEKNHARFHPFIQSSRVDVPPMRLAVLPRTKSFPMARVKLRGRCLNEYAKQCAQGGAPSAEQEKGIHVSAHGRKVMIRMRCASIQHRKHH